MALEILSVTFSLQLWMKIIDDGPKSQICLDENELKILLTIKHQMLKYTIQYAKMKQHKNTLLVVNFFVLNLRTHIMINLVLEFLLTIR